MSIIAEKNKGKISKASSASIFTVMKKKREDKEAIDKYLRGEMPLEELYARGIKFVQPL